MYVGRRTFYLIIRVIFVRLPLLSQDQGDILEQGDGGNRLRLIEKIKLEMKEELMHRPVIREAN